MAIPVGLAGFLTARQQGQQQDESELKQAGMLQALLQHADEQQQTQQLRSLMSSTGGDVDKALAAALQSGNVKAAHALAPLVESKRRAEESKALSGLDMNDPQALRAVAVKLKKPEFVTHAERIERQQANDAELAVMRGAPGKTIQPDVQEVQQSADQGTPAPQAATGAATPGVFDALTKSEIPQIAQAATNYQAQMQSPSAKALPPATWMNLAKGLQDREATLMNRPERQEPAIQTHTDGEGRLWERQRGGSWALALGPDGKPLTSKGAGAAAMEPDAVKVAAWEKLLFNTDPKGLGTASAQVRSQIANERARIGKGLGLTDSEMAMLPQDNKVKMKAVGNLTNWGATVARAAEKLDLDLGVAISYAEKLPLGQIQFLNKSVLAGRKEFNDPDANAYASAINSVRQEYARLMSGPTSNAMLPVEAMKKGNELLSSGVDVASLREVGNQMRRDAANTKTATTNQIAALRNTMVPGGAAPAGGGSGPSDGQTSKSKSGRPMVFRSGNWEYTD